MIKGSRSEISLALTAQFGFCTSNIKGLIYPYSGLCPKLWRNQTKLCEILKHGNMAVGLLSANGRQQSPL